MIKYFFSDLKPLLICFAAFIALINPIQKVFIVTSLQKQFDFNSTKEISIRSTWTAFIILILFLAVGQFVFSYFFHITLYAFEITCGTVLFFNGLMGLQNGAFLKLDSNLTIKDISSVPIGIPMIAGPASITAAVTFPATYGYLFTIISIAIALIINLVCMIYARNIGAFLNRFNLMNPLVRVFGLIVATIGIQIFLNGIVEFIAKVQR